MSTYLYCVLAPPRSSALPTGLAGIGGSPVRSLVSSDGTLEGWVSTVDDTALRATGRALAAQALLHNEVVNAGLRTGRTPAPARYGSHFPDDVACLADLARRAGELTGILEHVAGAIEMSVLIVPRTAARSATRPLSSEPSAGRRYLESVRSRRAEEQTRRAAAEVEAERIRERVRPFVRDEVQSFTPSGVLSIAHLVGVGDSERYRRALSAIVPTDRFRLVLGESRAPYSFAARKVGSSGHDSSSPSNSE